VAALEPGESLGVDGLEHVEQRVRDLDDAYGG
jgi:hypothetical protein